MSYPVYDTKTIMATLPWILGFTSSLVLGILSFGGMLVLWPSGIFWAVCALLLTMSCEGEINRQNNVSALAKLSDPDYAKTQLTKQYLLEKLAEFDHHRARVIIKNPGETISEDEQKKVCLLHEVVVIKFIDFCKVGFRNKQGFYQEVCMSQDQTKLFDHHKSTKFISNSEEIAILRSILENNRQQTDAQINVKKDQYPFYIKYYISLIKHIHHLQHSLQDSDASEVEKKYLIYMMKHISEIENLIKNILFNGDNIEFISNKIELNLDKNVNEYLTYEYNFDTKNFEKNIKIDFTKKKSKHTDIGKIKNEYFPSEDCAFTQSQEILLNALETYHNYKLSQWITQDDQKLWQEKLVWQYFYLRIASTLSIVSGILMTLGSSYLLLQAFSSIPFLMLIPASMSVFIIVPLAIISGLAYGLLFYNSLTDMLMENPFQKFWDKMYSNTQYCTFKTKFFMALSLLLFILAIVLTGCSAGTWITVFNQSAPLFIWINAIPELILKYAIPIFIGICELPFGLQNIANTLDYLEHHPKITGMLDICTEWYHGRLEWSLIWADCKKALYEWGLDVLEVDPEIFHNENLVQKCNPIRILLALCKILIGLIIAAHFFCESVIDDRLANFPVYLAISLSIIYNTFQDSNYFLGDNHVDASNTAELLQERYTQSGGHHHDDNVSMSTFGVFSESLMWLGGYWSYSFADDKDKRLLDDHIQCFKKPPSKKDTQTPVLPAQCTTANFKYSLFKASTDSDLTAAACCLVPHYKG